MPNPDSKYASLDPQQEKHHAFRQTHPKTQTRPAKPASARTRRHPVVPRFRQRSGRQRQIHEHVQPPCPLVRLRRTLDSPPQIRQQHQRNAVQPDGRTRMAAGLHRALRLHRHRRRFEPPARQHRPCHAGFDRRRPVARHVGTLPQRMAEKSGRLGLGTLQRRRLTFCRQYVRRRIPCGRHQFFQRQAKSHQRNAARRQARHQNHDCRRNHRLHPTTIQKKPIHAELLPRHRFRPDTNRKLHSRNRTGKENAAAVGQPLLLHHLPQTCLIQPLHLLFQTTSKSEKAT